MTPIARWLPAEFNSLTRRAGPGLNMRDWVDCDLESPRRRALHDDYPENGNDRGRDQQVIEARMHVHYGYKRSNNHSTDHPMFASSPVSKSGSNSAAGRIEDQFICCLHLMHGGDSLLDSRKPESVTMYLAPQWSHFHGT